ncbi:MAG TPA: metallopeptidase family protein [Roseiflexaceae bacterium]|nr:metallopeptidase family protein [Roseiflexaceae bacterium]HMP40635.1 metallopeptidase family protein [Roseiflexaceae bacterium]
MESDPFLATVAAVVDELPDEFQQYLDTVEICVAPKPSREQRRMLGLKPWQTLYGLYEGVPLTERSGDGLQLPDTITIFRIPLERDFPNRTELREQIRRTVLHELAHFFGISDDRLHELDAY